jgi:polysaccharide biosynthesis protein PelD
MLLTRWNRSQVAWRGLRGLLGRDSATHWATLESLMLTALGIGVGLWARPDDPLALAGPVPWGWAAPVLVALRYGVVLGVLSIATVLVAWQWLLTPGQLDAVPVSYFLGALLLVMVCGEFAGLWRGRNQRLAEANTYLQERVEGITKRLFITQRSHDILQQELLQRPTTLRDALAHMQQRALAGGLGPERIAQELLDHLAAASQLESAQILRLDGDVLGEPLATLGPVLPVAVNDPLIAQALAERQLVHVRSMLKQVGAKEGTQTQHLIANPLSLGEARQGALLVVSRMPFLALNADALLSMAVLCSAVSDVAAITREARSVTLALPACPAAFATELARLSRLAREHDVPSRLVLFAYEDPEQSEKQRADMMRRTRSEDVSWAWSSPTADHFAVILPLAAHWASQGYLARVLRELGGKRDWAELHMRVQTFSLGRHDVLPALRAAQPPGDNTGHPGIQRPQGSNSAASSAANGDANSDANSDAHLDAAAQTPGAAGLSLAAPEPVRADAAATALGVSETTLGG